MIVLGIILGVAVVSLVGGVVLSVALMRATSTALAQLLEHEP
jgi:hypothetical protein